MSYVHQWFCVVSRQMKSSPYQPWDELSFTKLVLQTLIPRRTKQDTQFSLGSAIQITSTVASLSFWDEIIMEMISTKWI